MLSKKIMMATDAACQSVCMAEEGAFHYGEKFTKWDRWCAWWSGFFAGWDNTTGYFEFIPVSRLVGQVIRKWLFTKFKFLRCAQR